MSERTMAQRKPGPSPTFTPIVHEVLRSAGQPLDPVTRALMESRFGHRFNQVQVYTDAKAADSARAVNALAYTIGREVVFGAGQYAPQTREGQKLLAHELTHVVQQERGGHTRPTLDGSGPLEQAASDVAAAFVRSSGPVAVQGASALGIACSPDAQEPWWKRARHSLGELADKVEEKYAAARQEVEQILIRADVRRRVLQSIADTYLPALTQTIEQAVNKFEDREFERPPATVDPLAHPSLARAEHFGDSYQIAQARLMRQFAGVVVKSPWELTGIAQIFAHPVNTLKGLGELPGPAGPLNPVKELGLRVGALDDLITKDKPAKQVLYEYLDNQIPYPERVQAQAMNLLKGLGEKYIEAAGYRVNPTTGEIEKGGRARWGEIPWRLLMDVGTFFIPAGAAIKEAKVVGTAGEAVQASKAVGRLSELEKGLQATSALDETSEALTALERGADTPRVPAIHTEPVKPVATSPRPQWAAYEVDYDKARARRVETGTTAEKDVFGETVADLLMDKAGYKLVGWHVSPQGIDRIWQNKGVPTVSWPKYVIGEVKYSTHDKSPRSLLSTLTSGEVQGKPRWTNDRLEEALPMADRATILADMQIHPPVRWLLRWNPKTRRVEKAIL